MKKIIIIFLLFSSLSFSYTRKEQIQENLSKVGIKQEIIDETQKMDFEIRDLVTFENNENVIGEKLNRLLALLKKDERNYIVSEDIITIYESKIGKDYEKYLKIFDSIILLYMVLSNNKKASIVYMSQVLKLKIGKVLLKIHI